MENTTRELNQKGLSFNRNFGEKQTKDLKIFLKLTPSEHLAIKNKAKMVNMSMNKLAKYLLLNINLEISIKT